MASGSTYMGPVSQPESQQLTAKGVGNAGTSTYGNGDKVLTPQPGGTDWQSIFNSYNTPVDLNSQDPAKDAQYNAWYRGMGLQQNDINANTARDTADLNANLAAQRPIWADTLAQGLKNISGTNEANGMFNSGQRLDQQNEFQTQQEHQQQAAETGVRSQIDNANAAAQQQLQGLAAQNAEQQLAARQRLAQDQVANNQNPLVTSMLKQQLGQMGINF